MPTRESLEVLNQQYRDILRIKNTYAIEGEISAFQILEIEKSSASAECCEIVILKVDEVSSERLRQFQFGHIVKYVAKKQQYLNHIKIIENELIEDFTIIILVLLCKGKWDVPERKLPLESKTKEKGILKRTPQRYEQYGEIIKLFEAIRLEDSVRNGSDYLCRTIEEINSIKKVTFYFEDKEENRLQPITIKSDEIDMNLIAVMLLKYLNVIQQHDIFGERGVEPIREDLELSVPNSNGNIGYFGEVDHLIPWQIDHLINWRPVVENASRSDSKLVNKSYNYS